MLALRYLINFQSILCVEMDTLCVDPDQVASLKLFSKEL